MGYPTQKPLALLRRIINASAPEGGTILDPFCGCATACIAAEQRGRQWIGIDISPKAADLVRVRMRNELGLFYAGAHRTDIPERTDLGRVPTYNCADNRKYLYGEQGGYCNGCEEHFAPRHLQVDHIVPRAKGGTDHISNLQLLCGACNSTKGTKTQEELLVLLTDKGWIKRKKAAFHYNFCRMAPDAALHVVGRSGSEVEPPREISQARFKLTHCRNIATIDKGVPNMRRLRPMHLAAVIVALADTFVRATNSSRSSLGRRVARTPSLIQRIESGSASLRTIDRLLMHISCHWPPHMDWPAEIPRPAPSARNAARVA